MPTPPPSPPTPQSLEGAGKIVGINFLIQGNIITALPFQCLNVRGGERETERERDRERESEKERERERERE